MATTTKKSRWVRLPRLLDDPEYRAAQEKVSETKAQLGQVRAELDRRFDGWAARVPTIQEAAVAVLEGGDPEDDPQAAWMEETAQLQRRARILEEALRLACKRRDMLRGAAWRRVLAPLLPAYREYLQEAADLAAELVALSEEERELRDHFNRESVIPGTFALIPLAPVAHLLAGWLESVKRYHGITPRTKR